MDQVSIWRGEFGNAYTDRNEVDWLSKVFVFNNIITGLDIQNVLEIGCNKGHNMVAVQYLLGDRVEIIGIEPNEYAAHIARRKGFAVQDGTIYNLPFIDNYFDLVFTNGVLIHIPPSKLERAIQEMYRVSKRYVLAIEYYAKEETVIPYRGYNDLLWKRDFLHEFKSVYPELMLKEHWSFGTEENPTCDRMDGWLFKKKNVYYK